MYLGLSCFIGYLVEKNMDVVWIGKTPFINHLKVFGCDPYIHILKEKMKKCIVIGYKYGVKGFKIWNLIATKNVYNHVIFCRYY